MPNIYAMEREDEEPYGDLEPPPTGWRSLWIVRWTKSKIVNPLIAILSRYRPFLIFSDLIGEREREK